MLWLFAAMVASASIALLFRAADRVSAHRPAVVTANYLAAAFVSLLTLLSGDASGGIGWAVVAGAAGGVFYLLGFVLYQSAVSDCGVGISSSVIKLGILVPLVVSVAAWGESPPALQWAGVMLGLLALAALGLPSRDSRGRLSPVLLLLFVCGGLAELSNKLFQKKAVPGTESVFLLSVFSTAMLLSLPMLARSGWRIDAKSLGMGLAVGVPNMLASRFLLAALGELPAPVAFAGYGSGTILVAGIAARAVFGERPSRPALVSMLLTAVSLLLVNLAPASVSG